MSPADHTDRRSLSKPLPFMPGSDEDGNLVFQLPTLGRIAPTADGFVFIGEKMTPVHFKKQTP